MSLSDDTDPASMRDGAVGNARTEPGDAPEVDLDEARVQAQVEAALFGGPRRQIKIARFVVLSELGRGGMGVIYSAYDEQLDRKIAIKLLHLAGHGGPDDKQRLLREAQSMAKLSHTNVVQVYEVGEHEGQLFIAMECVVGSDLRQWLRDGPHPWRDVVRVLTAAGRGLAAAHAADLVHRDFKPENALIDELGQVKITDFGLTRVRTSPVDAETLETVVPDGEGSDPADPLTQTSDMAGTPAYMAPEQWVGAELEPATDQFALCVVFFEALYGTRPFAGTTLAEIAASVVGGTIIDAPRPSGVPERVLRAVRRGLSSHPADRFASIDALLDAVGRDPARARRDVITGGVAVATLAGVYALTGPKEVETCAGGEAAMAAIWDEARATQVRAAFSETGLAYADSASVATTRVLDEYVEQWAQVHRGVCERAAKGERSGEHLDAAMACLDQRKVGLATTIEALTHADAQTVDAAFDVVLALPSVDQCTNALALSTWLRQPEDAAVRETVAALRRRLARVDAAQAFGGLPAAKADAEGLSREASDVPYPPVRAEALRLLGSLQERTGEIETAKATLSAALREAQAGRHLDVTQQVAEELAYLVGYRQGDRAGGVVFAELSLGALQAMEGPDAERDGLLTTRGAIAYRDGDYASAAALFERAMELRMRTHGRQRPSVVGNLGTAYTKLDRLDDAWDLLHRALEQAEADKRHEHPDVASILVSLGTIQLMRGKLPEAAALYGRGVAIYRTSLGERGPELGTALGQLGVIHAMQGDNEQGLALLVEAKAVFVAAYGDDHADIASVLANTSIVLSSMGRMEEAAATDLVALRMRERLIGPDHPDLANSHSNYGSLLDELGRSVEAVEHLERAAAIFDRAAAGGKSKPASASTQLALALALRHLDRPTEALVHYERAVAIAHEHPDHSRELAARAEYRLAQALWDLGGDRKRARELAASAVDNYADSPNPETAAEVKAWIAAH